MFLGIDHTAIAVWDTDQSLRFWRDAVGLRVAGDGVNHGPEQEHLNHVFGARVHITGLRAAAGPGVELLEYEAPRDGRPMPPDSRASDLWHWHITVEAKTIRGAEKLVRAGGGQQVSAGATAPKELGVRAALLVRDPDGHAVQLVER